MNRIIAVTVMPPTAEPTPIPTTALYDRPDEFKGIVADDDCVVVANDNCVAAADDCVAVAGAVATDIAVEVDTDIAIVYPGQFIYKMHCYMEGSIPQYLQKYSTCLDS